ncbi:sensor histidine kinase [Actinophytocola sp.]|uniref:sensor histidine kinase n=1 Tax=Actinophytocola sp. TaxID=1872138 RepID=UPI00389B1C46
MWQRVRPVWVDLGLVVLVVAVQLWPFLARGSESGDPWSPGGYVCVVASALPVLWRRRAPVAALVTSLVATALYDLAETTPAQPVWYAGLVVSYNVAVESPRWLRVALLVFGIGGTVVFKSSETALRSAVLFIAVYAIGRAVAAARAQAERMAHEREIETERAAERERARIARDMHDILSHAVSIMVVQAEAGPVVLAKDPARAEATFDTIAAAGRDAMVQLRRILTVLKTDDGPHAPQPTLVDLPKLVADSGVAYEVVGEPFAVSPDVELAVYRITQEAITNVIRHANATRADVRLTWEPKRLTVDITDDGHGTPVPSDGNGLIGIRERAAACGGTAVAGPRPDGRGFRVTARFPA